LFAKGAAVIGRAVRRIVVEASRIPRSASSETFQASQPPTAAAELLDEHPVAARVSSAIEEVAAAWTLDLLGLPAG
jgi:hypothetical protein